MKLWSSLTFVTVLALGACTKSEPTPASATPTPNPVATPAAAAPATTAPAGLAAEGTQAPAIDTTAHNGEHVSLAALRGKSVVVYFYPKDDTPGCTKEACEIRDSWDKIKGTGAVVLGVSTQDAASHVAFAEKYKLPFLLLPDSDGAITKAYGVPMHNGLAKRVTFVIDPQGKIAKVFPDVNPSGHASEILAVLSTLHS
ncbi:MAG TPA: peroxiredoxin [Polyangiaceae bacterium]|jgi:peroxiredoxin Q/BCP